VWIGVIRFIIANLKHVLRFIELKCNLCSTDKLIGFIALTPRHNGMSRIAVQCDSPGMNVTKWMLTWKLFRNNCNTELHEVTANGLLSDVRSKTEGQKD